MTNDEKRKFVKLQGRELGAGRKEAEKLLFEWVKTGVVSFNFFHEVLQEWYEKEDTFVPRTDYEMYFLEAEIAMKRNQDGGDL